MRKQLYILAITAMMLIMASCARVPVLHLHEDGHLPIAMPGIELSLDIYWDYTLDNGWQYSDHYDWRSEWIYGWDDVDRQIFGDSIGYSTKPNTFNIRRYFTDQDPDAPHTSSESFQIYDTLFLATYNPGFYDILAWNEVETLDGVQAIRLDETTSLDSVMAYTGQNRLAKIQGSEDEHTTQTVHYQPEALFSGYYQNLEVTTDMEDYTYDPVRNIYYRHLDMELLPVTYIYLVQLILRHNYGRVDNTTGNATLSGMAYSTCLNSGLAGETPVNVYFNTRMKSHLQKHDGEDVDVIGGRLYTFGICNVNPNRVRNRIISGQQIEASQTASDIYASDEHRHYVDLDVVFSNGNDSVMSFDVTDQVRKLYRGGVLTLELDMDTVPIPGSKHSLFDVTVVDPDSVTYEFDM